MVQIHAEVSFTEILGYMGLYFKQAEKLCYSQVTSLHKNAIF